ncbi:MAG TPA: DUF2273 domain-containing protein [Firmicutes bacterium]|nr:DUF2273 domain-containing protein [Bacillota bacterium]
MKEELLALFARHRGKIIGCLIGFVLGWLIISRGIIETLVLFICASLGYYIGKRLDDGGELGEILEHFWPSNKR